MEGDPLCLIEGMTIAAVAVGATQGYIYLRAEYPHAYRALNTAIAAAYQARYLGSDVLGSGKRFDLEVRLGAGAYVCGEETSMLESLEGKRGEIRVRPPLPAIKGLFGQPTIVNNVMTFASVPTILHQGAEFYKNFGMGRSRGTLPLQLAGNIKRGGLVERAFGVSLRELLYDYGGGSATGRPIRAVQVGGPLGAYIPASQFDVLIDYEALAAIGALLGHGGIVVFDDTVDMARMARYAMEFCAVESCGKCTPCRIGSTRGVEVVDKILAGVDSERNLAVAGEPVQHHVAGFAVRAGRHDAVPGTKRAQAFQRGFPGARAAVAEARGVIEQRGHRDCIRARVGRQFRGQHRPLGPGRADTHGRPGRRRDADRAACITACRTWSCWRRPPISRTLLLALRSARDSLSDLRRSARSKSLTAREAADVKITVAWERFSALLQRRRNLTGRTGCGLCGAETAEDAIREITRVGPGPTVSAESLHEAIEQLGTPATDQCAHWQRACRGVGYSGQGNPTRARGCRAAQCARQGDRRARALGCGSAARVTC